MTRATSVIAALATFALCGVAAACPMCKDTIANTAAGSNPAVGGGLPGGFNFSIYYMLGSLFLVIGGFGYFLFRTIRSTDQATARRGFPVGR